MKSYLIDTGLILTRMMDSGDKVSKYTGFFLTLLSKTTFRPTLEAIWSSLSC